MKKGKKNIFKENIKTIIIILVVVVIVVISLIYNNFIDYKKTYTVINGSVEKVSDTYMYVLKNETVLDIDKNMVAVPIIEQNKRASKGEIVAIYKNNTYDKAQEEILNLDKEIQTMIKDLPTVYSSDVSLIDSKISDVVAQLKDETSYVKMQEYKNKIDDLLSKKINVLGQLSPNGSKIRELIEKRNTLQENTKNSNNSIKASVAGAVTYKIDGLENAFEYNDILNFSTEKFEEVISKYNSNNTNNFGIKIVDNFQCYLLVKESNDENIEYIKQGRSYQIKLLNIDNEFSNYVKLEKTIKGNNCTYNIFKLENNVSSLLDTREIGAEIIWKKEEGLVVPLNAITRENEIDYVTLVSGGEYIKIPVKITISNDTISIVENYTKEEKEKLGITDTDSLKIYDQLLIESKK